MVDSKKLYLAPMDGVTDRAFRELCKLHGADFVYNEFVSADSIIRNVEKSLKKIEFSDCERPIGIQIFGNNSDTIAKAAQIVESRYNPDEININCCCPMRNITDKGCGAALLKDINCLVNIIENVIKATKTPITVKTRLGWDEKNIIIEELVIKLQNIGVKKIIIHCRTRSQMFTGFPRYEYLSQLKSNNNINIEIIGNGNVVDLESYKNMLNTGVNGVMIGRGAIGNPWIFSNLKNLKIEKIDSYRLIETVEEHIRLSLKYTNEKYTILTMKKHYSGYFKNLPYFKNFKIKLMMSNKIGDVIKILKEIRSEYKDK